MKRVGETGGQYNTIQYNTVCVSNMACERLMWRLSPAVDEEIICYSNFGRDVFARTEPDGRQSLRRPCTRRARTAAVHPLHERDASWNACHDTAFNHNSCSTSEEMAVGNGKAQTRVQLTLKTIEYYTTQTGAVQKTFCTRHQV